MLVIGLYFGLGAYVYTTVRSLWADYSLFWRRFYSLLFWSVSLLPLLSAFMIEWIGSEGLRGVRTFLFTGIFMIFIAKIFASLFILVDDLRRLVIWFLDMLPGHSSHDASRSDFVRKLSLGAAAIPVATMSFGILSGAHDYRIRRRVLSFPNLPSAFDGIRLAQISDIHTGSFFNKTAVRGGVEMLQSEKPDMFFFTGDLVNDESREAQPYLDIFRKIKAPMGQFSVMGNHDYGDYRRWPSEAAKQADVKNLHEMHRYMNWDLLLNSHRILQVGDEKIAVLGVENWGVGRFSKYGNLAKTHTGTEDVPFKILLSHDPSHWDAQIRPDYPDIDLTLSGHTHGFQFGVEWGNFRWSPSQYIYKQWADHYQEGQQHIYVNRGFGYIGYPGRIGILPEITILELKRG
jgi:hypothetical protein